MEDEGQEGEFRRSGGYLFTPAEQRGILSIKKKGVMSHYATYCHIMSK